MTRRILLVAGVSLIVGSCAPRLAPLTGVPAPKRLPRAELRPGHWKIVFDWSLTDGEMHGRGEGVARVAYPDSGRLDFFLAGGYSGGAAVLIGNTVQAPGGDLVQRIVPSAPVLWAALGRAAVPPAADTTVRVDGATLRADIGQPTAWRLTYRGDTLVRLERVDGGRVTEWVERADSTHVHYRQEKARRTVDLTVKRVEPAQDFDASIWSIPR